MHTDNIVEFPLSKQADTATFNLVGELLAEALVDNGEEIIIESKSQEFFYDTEVHIVTDPLLKAIIEYEDVTETEDKINVNVFGTVKGVQGKKTDYTFCFWMWCNDTANALRNNCDKTLRRSSPVEIELNESPNAFSSTVFELELYKKDNMCVLSALGHGRGFLLFDEST